MVQALKQHNKEAARDFCTWNKYLEDLRKSDSSSSFTSSSSSSINYMQYSPNTVHPLVYHLHGHTDIPQSMVVTESDYLDFLIHMVKNCLTLDNRAILILDYIEVNWHMVLSMGCHSILFPGSHSHFSSFLSQK
jgi:hypothetical protein